MPRKILHLDLDAFFCAVEEQYNQSLPGQPFAVGGRPEHRGVVAACSYAARRYGIHSAMPMARAVRLCPQLIIVPSRYKLYQAASRAVMAILHDLTPFVEQLSIDEAFLDVTELAEPGQAIARDLQARIRRDLKLPCSIGVATSKLVAKIANNVGKASFQFEGDSTPRAITVVLPGQEAAFLAPLPVKELWGVGPKTEAKLTQIGLHTIGELADWSEADLVRRFGKHGHDLARRARGLDDRQVEPEHEAKSISQETTFARDISDVQLLRQTLRKLSEQVGQRLRQSDLLGTTIKLKLRWSDFKTLTRQVTLKQPTNLDSEIYGAIVELFETSWPPGRRVRLLGVGVTNFETTARQLELWNADFEADQRLQSTLDELRERFGDRTVQRGTELIDGAE
jgi:DNA polymerase-4